MAMPLLISPSGYKLPKLNHVCWSFHDQMSRQAGLLFINSSFLSGRTQPACHQQLHLRGIPTGTDTPSEQQAATTTTTGSVSAHVTFPPLQKHLDAAAAGRKSSAYLLILEKPDQKNNISDGEIIICHREYFGARLFPSSPLRVPHMAVRGSCEPSMLLVDDSAC